MKNRLFKAVAVLTVCASMLTGGPLTAAAEFNSSKFNEEKFDEAWVMPTLPKVHVGGNQYNIFVATDGDDSNDGSISNPLKTLTGARNKIRELKKTNDFSQTSVYVNVRGGTYSQDGFELTDEDSGTADYPITYRAYKDEKVSVIGGTTIPSSAWTLVEDESTLARLPEEARGKVYKASMSTLGYTREQIGEMKYYGQYIAPKHQPDTPDYPSPVELYCDGEAQLLSRYPNDDFILIKNVVKSSIEWLWRDSTVPIDMTRDKSGFILSYEGNRHDRWLTADQAKMYGFWKFDWCDSSVDIKAIDTRKKTIEGSIAVSRGVKAHDGIGGRYYVYNLLEEIDIPGEYFLDRNDSNLTMYYYPEKDFSECVVQASISLSPVVSFKGAKNIVIEGMSLSISRDSGVKMVDSENINVNNCIISATSGEGMYISNCENCGVTNSEIYNTEGGVNLLSYCPMTGGTEQRKLLNHSRNYAINNKIHDFARMEKINAHAVHVFGVGNYVAHNEIYNGDHFAMQVNQADDNIIEYNHIHDVLLDSSDAGCIYIAGGWEIQNTIMRYNYIHDFGDQPNLHAFYPDGGACSTRIYGNIVQDPGDYGSALMITGRNHTISNNIWINNKTNSIHGGILKAPLYGEATYADVRNYISPETNPDGYTKWLDRWPWMESYLDPENISKLTGNVIKNNINIDGEGIDLPGEFFEYGDVEDDILVKKSDIPYSTGANGIIEIDQDAIKKRIPDWEYIDLSKIGPVDEYKRTSSFEGVDGGNTIGAVTTKPNDKLGASVTLALRKNKSIVNGETKYIDPDNAEVYPKTVNNRTLVPVRFISENFGADVKWDASTKTVIIDYAGKKIYMQIGSNKLVVDGKVTEMDVAPAIMENRTMIPLRALCETALSKKVFWDDKGLIVVSDKDNILDSVNDAAYIDEVLAKLN